MKHTIRQASLLGQGKSTLARRLIMDSSSDSNLNTLDPTVSSVLYSIVFTEELDLNEESPKMHTIQRKGDPFFKAQS